MNRIIGAFMVAGLLLTGCATQVSLTDSEIAQQFPELTLLGENLARAESDEVDLLSSKLFSAASADYKEARPWAEAGNNKANTLAQRGQAKLAQAVASSERAKEELSAVLQARSRALSAGAERKSANAFAEADKQLMALGNLVAENKIADVRESRQALSQIYARLEVDALKRATIKEAETLIFEARKQGADGYAPLTLKAADEELALASGVLEADADARAKAADHAQKAYRMANQALQITEIIKEFRQSNMTDEQIVLWYQNQLAAAVAPVVAEPDFSKPNRALIAELSGKLAGLRDEARQVSTALAAKEDALREMAVTTAAERARQEAFEARFRTIQNSFQPDEAEVYRQGNDVLIRSYGFNFPSGGSEIQSENFPLLNKIIRAISEFPESRIIVSGHTDNRGSDELNLNLSSARAEKVQRFLVDVGNIDASRVSSVGYGKTKPLASNETADGRAANRRVEILIENP